MKRTTTPPQHVTPGLFDSADVYALADNNTKLQAQVARLKKELAEWKKWYEKLTADFNRLLEVKMSDEQHPLYYENKRLKHEVAQLRQTLLAETRGSVHTRARGLGKEALTKLLTLCHPDRWSQGQPATALAHEMCVAINAMREGVAS